MRKDEKIKPSENIEAIEAMIKGGITQKEIAVIFRCSKQSIHVIKKENGFEPDKKLFRDCPVHSCNCPKSTVN